MSVGERVARNVRNVRTSRFVMIVLKKGVETTVTLVDIASSAKKPVNSRSVKNARTVEIVRSATNVPNVNSSAGSNYVMNAGRQDVLIVRSAKSVENARTVLTLIRRPASTVKTTTVLIVGLA